MAAADPGFLPGGGRPEMDSLIWDGMGGFWHEKTDLQHFKMFIAMLCLLPVPGRRNRDFGADHSVPGVGARTNTHILDPRLNRK